MINVEDFNKVDMRVGTVLKVSLNKRARIPAYKVTIDLGKDLGIKTSSAQITDLYNEENLVGRQVIVVSNFTPMRIGDVKSEVRILGTDSSIGVALLNIDSKVPNGSRIY